MLIVIIIIIIITLICNDDDDDLYYMPFNLEVVFFCYKSNKEKRKMVNHPFICQIVDCCHHLFFVDCTLVYIWYMSLRVCLI